MKRWLALGLLGAVSMLAAVQPDVPALSPGGPINAADTAWVLCATALVLLMTPGLSFFYAGMVQHKNVVSTMLQSFIAMALVSVIWVVVGFSLAFGHSFHGLIGDPRTF